MKRWGCISFAIGLCGLALSERAALCQIIDRLSPHEATTQTLAGKWIVIEYGRPYLKGRNLIGNIVRYGQMWRTGADEAPVLSTEGDLMIGELRVPTGRYSLFTIPGKDHWTLVVNKVPNLMGRNGYNSQKDLGRVEMNVDMQAAVTEQFTIAIDKTTADRGVLKMSWASVVVSVPISAKQP